MKAIIVEDEPRVRKGLSEGIVWNECGFELSGTAANGQEGLELFDQVQPDLVICDIRMPVMDGLAMTEAILERNEHVRIIILSGYDEFEYAQRCLSLGVKSYLLKPVGKQQLMEEMIKIRKEWLKDRLEQNQAAAYMDKLRTQLPGLRAAFLEDWLSRKDSAGSMSLTESLDFLKIPLQLDTGTAIAILELDIEEGGKYNHSDLHLLQFAMQKITEELLGDRGVTYLRGNGQTVVLFQEKNSEISDEFMMWIEMAKQEITRLLKVTVTIGIGTEITTAREIPKQFKAALNALRMKLTVGTGVILHEGLLLPSLNQHVILNEADRDLIVHSVETGDIQKLKALIMHYLGADAASAALPRLHLQELVYPLGGLYTSLLHRLGRTLGEVLGEEDRERFREPERFRSLEDMRAWWVARFEQLSSFYEGFRSDRKAKLVQSVEAYVEEHITENVTREQAARHVHINVSYLSRIFKEATGESFSDYVLRRKMEKAIRLLREEDAMVYEVTDMLGYKDPSYFARIFKKYTGKSPSDFQK